MRIGHVPPSHTIYIPQFSRSTGVIRLNTDVSAVALNVCVRPLFEPAQRIGSASNVCKRLRDSGAFAEPLIKAFAEATKSKRVPENQDSDALLWRLIRS